MFDLYVCVMCKEVHGGSDGVVASYENAPDGTTYESSFSDCDSMAVTTYLQQGDVPLASNQAYEVLGHGHYEVEATGNEQENENEIYDSIANGRVTTNLLQGDVPLASNQAYGILGHDHYEVEATGNEQENENETYNSVASGKYFTSYVCVVCTEVHGGSDGVVASYGNTPDGATYESSFSDSDSMVDNSLYSNTGQVTFSESTVHESVSKHLSSLSLPNFSQFIAIILISHVSIHADWFWWRTQIFFTGILLCSNHCMW